MVKETDRKRLMHRQSQSEYCDRKRQSLGRGIDQLHAALLEVEEQQAEQSWAVADA